jgi:hydroxymethylglutaryl-CoA synthase
MFSNNSSVGISAMSAYLPRFRVRLEDWCEWTGNSWEKVQACIGHSFRVLGDHENVYTMASNAVLRLIQQNQIDPQTVGFLGFGTESSRDNSVGAVIIRGMVDRALEEIGLPRLSRNLEVPEFKHSCLGGIYAIKTAIRYVSTDGSDRKAVVAVSDVAEFERGSSAEPTQGAGAIAMLVEEQPRLLEIDLRRTGSVSDYRGPDYRKPLNRYLNGYQEIKIAHGINGSNKKNGSNGNNNCHRSNGQRLRFSDFPVISGEYSALAYIDEVIHAVEEMLLRIDAPAIVYYESIRGLFFHRPYHIIPIRVLSFLYVRALAQANRNGDELRSLCLDAGVSCDEVVAEARSDPPDFLSSVLSTRGRPINPYKTTSAVAAALRKRESFRSLLAKKMSLGSETMTQMGNLCTAALPAWIAAGLEEAYYRGVELTGAPVVAVGYGSGDAAEAIPTRVALEWQYAAQRMGIEAALADPIDLTQAQYEAHHNGYAVSGMFYSPKQEFVISHVGDRYDKNFQDLAVEYYKYMT